MPEARALETSKNAGETSGGQPPSRFPPFPDNPLIPGAIVVLLTLVVYWQILGFSFVNFDDNTNIFANPHLTPVTAKGISYLWTHGYYELYMPVTYTIWGICSSLFPLAKPVYVPGGGNAFVNPAAFHALSLFLHTANAALVFALLYRLLRRTWPACAGALLFALHPVQVESVAWVTGMNNLTSGFFGLLALFFYVASADKTADGATKLGSRARLSYAAATFFFLLALLSKPTVAGLPLVAAALDWGVLGRPPSRWLKMLAPWVLLSLALAVITHFTSQTSQRLHLALWIRPFIAGDALAIYVSKLLVPINVSINVGRSMYLVQSSWWGYVTWIFPAAIALILWRAGKSARLLRAGAAVFVAALFPMLGFVLYYTMAMTTVSGRYLYLAMLGASLAAAWFVSNKRFPVGVRGGVFSVALLLYTMQTLHQIPYWKDTYVLAQAQVAVNPSDHSSQSNYAIALAEKGNAAESLPHFRAAVALQPGNAIYRYHLGCTLEDSGDIAGAEEPLRNSVRLDPRFALAQIRLGGVLLKQNKTQEALEPLRAAAALDPSDVSAGYLLGVALAGTQQYKEAETELRRVVSLSSAIPQARFALGRVLEKQGRRSEAAQIYQEILQTTPDNPQAKQALLKLGGPPPRAQ